jgi:hypothetical protein
MMFGSDSKGENENGIRGSRVPLGAERTGHCLLLSQGMAEGLTRVNTNT